MMIFVPREVRTIDYVIGRSTFDIQEIRVLDGDIVYNFTIEKTKYGQHSTDHYFTGNMEP